MTPPPPGSLQDRFSNSSRFEYSFFDDRDAKKMLLCYIYLNFEFGLFLLKSICLQQIILLSWEYSSMLKKALVNNLQVEALRLSNEYFLC